MRLGFAVAINVDPGRAAGGRGAGRRRRGVHAQVPGAVCRVEAPAEDDRAGDAHARPRHPAVRRGGVARRRAAFARQGDPKRVVDAYLARRRRRREDAGRRPRRRTAGARRGAPRTDHGRARAAGARGRPRSTHVELVHADGAAGHVFESGQPMDIVLGVQAPRDRCTDFVFGVGDLHRGRRLLLSAPTPRSKAACPRELAGTARSCSVDIDRAGSRRPAPTGSTSRCTAPDGVPYDYHRLLYSFRVTSPVKDIGIYRPAAPVVVRRRHRDRSGRRTDDGQSHESPDAGGPDSAARRRRRWPPASSGTRRHASSSPTACSTCCTPATSGTCRPRAASATR